MFIRQSACELWTRVVQSLFSPTDVMTNTKHFAETHTHQHIHQHGPMPTLQHAWQATALSCIVGIVWGCCNGINKHTASPSTRPHHTVSLRKPKHSWLVQLLYNPLFYLAQGSNALASACFVWLTGQHACSLAIAVACANGTSLAVTACIDVLFLGQRGCQKQAVGVGLVTVGLLLTLCGITLCALG